MQQQHSGASDYQPQPPFWKSRAGIALIMLGLVAGFYLLREHWAHVTGNWTYLLLLLCPLMHLFGHGGHDGHSGHGGHAHRHADQDAAEDKRR